MFKNNLSKYLVSLSLLTVLFFITRFLNLTAIPVFADEAIYIRWSQIIRSVETLRFIPLTDGKQPLYMWLLAPLLKFISDPLQAGRIVSIFSGLGIALTISLLTTIVFNFNSKINSIHGFLTESVFKHYRSGLLTFFLYLLLPFSFFFDRMALPDNLLSFFGSLSLFLSLFLAKFPRLDLSLILGVVLGLAWLTKSPAIYFLILSLLTFIFINYRRPKLFILPFISAIIAFIIYNLLRLGPQFHQIALRNRDYIWSISEILKHPLDPFVPHLFDVFKIYLQYISVPIITIPLIGLLIAVSIRGKKLFTHNLSLIVLILWWLLPLLANMTFAKVFTSRYILFTLPPLIILITFGFQVFIRSTRPIFNSRLTQFFLLFLSLLANLIWIYRISFMPYTTKLPAVEAGYLQDWTSGWGIQPASAYLISRSQQHNVIVGTEGYFGTLPDGLQIYTNQIPQLTVFGVGTGLNQIPEKLINAKNAGDDVYLLINRNRHPLTANPAFILDIIARYPKPDGDQLILIKI